MSVVGVVVPYEDERPYSTLLLDSREVVQEKVVILLEVVALLLVKRKGGMEKMEMRLLSVSAMYRVEEASRKRPPGYLS